MEKEVELPIMENMSAKKVQPKPEDTFIEIVPNSH